MIEEAAKRYAAGEITKSRIERAERAFKAGAYYRINSIWHQPTECPKIREHILVQTGGGDFTSWFATQDIMNVFARFKVRQWAYTKDVLPRKEGKQ